MKFINLDRQSKKLLKINIKSIKKILINSQFIMGREVFKLEDELKKFTGSKYCVTTSSGTDALLIALMSLNLKKGSEVITSPFTYVSTVDTILRLNCKPVFVDIDKDTCNISVNEIKKNITNKTAAIVPVSLFGQTAELKKINQIASSYNIPVIEDAAQSFGSEHYNRKSCNLSTIGCTSFFPTKALGCYGDGGALFTNNKRLAEKCRMIRNHGQKKKYFYETLGINGRLDNIQAAVLLNKLKKFPTEIKNRKLKAKYYLKNLNLKEIEFLKTFEYNSNVHTLFNIKVKKRDKLIKFLKTKNIPTMIYYPKPLNFYKPFKKFIKKNIKLNNSKKVSREILSIPFSPYMLKQEQDNVIKHIKLFYEKK